MPNILVLPIDAGLAIDGNKLSDHNRASISISQDRIENRKRMADGTMRTFVVAQKRKFKTSWSYLPVRDNQTVDGFWGAQSLINHHNVTFGEFTLRLSYGDGSHEDVLCMYDDFSWQLKKRGKYTDLYDIDVTYEEV